MKMIPSLAVWLALVSLGPGFSGAAAGAEEGIALAIIYDTSGSMRDPVPDQHGRSSPKYIIANRALVAVARQLQAYSTNTASGVPRKINAGLFIFHHDGAREAVRFGPFNAAALENWAAGFNAPDGNTPLGNTLSTAVRTVLDSPLSRKHVLVITDGMNTAGPAPSAVLPQLRQRATLQQANFAVHFIAFDVDAKVFDPVKRLGATVVSAADEKQLNTQLDYILQRKILLEEEEPKKP
jgi:hypothetical protein